jgi:hypothetical protein
MTVKTSIVLRYTENLFNDKHLETQQVSFYIQSILMVRITLTYIYRLHLKQKD